MWIILLVWGVIFEVWEVSKFEKFKIEVGEPTINDFLAYWLENMVGDANEEVDHIGRLESSDLETEQVLEEVQTEK